MGKVWYNYMCMTTHKYSMFSWSIWFLADIHPFVRPKNKPPFCLGQDKCIYKQYIFCPNPWIITDGEKAVFHKDKGIVAMVSYLFLEGLDFNPTQRVKYEEGENNFQKKQP